jgi:hypothetical protein
MCKHYCKYVCYSEADEKTGIDPTKVTMAAMLLLFISVTVATLLFKSSHFEYSQIMMEHFTLRCAFS